jgi:hypothetical protein
MPAETAPPKRSVSTVNGAACITAVLPAMYPVLHSTTKATAGSVSLAAAAVTTAGARPAALMLRMFIAENSTL